MAYVLLGKRNADRVLDAVKARAAELQNTSGLEAGLAVVICWGRSS